MTFSAEAADSYARQRRELEEVLVVAETASESWGIVVRDDRRRHTGDLLFKQITMRARSQLRLAPSPESLATMDWRELDVPSLYTVLRVILEAYVNLFYLVIDTVDEEERELRFRAWDACGEVIRCKGLKSLDESSPHLPRLEAERDSLIDAFESHSMFSGLSAHVVRDVKSGRSPLLLERYKIAAAAGIHPRNYHGLYKHASDLSHSGALAEAQIPGLLRSADVQIDFARSTLRHTESLLSLMILQYSELYRRSRWRVEDDVLMRMMIWKEILADGRTLSEIVQ